MISLRKIAAYMAFIAFYLVLNCSFALSLKSQNPPINIEKSFHEKFPQAEKHKWGNTTEKDKEYVVEFFLKDVAHKVYFDVNGKIIKTEKEIEVRSLPTAIIKSLDRHYSSYKIAKCYSIETNSRITAYELKLKADGEKTTVIMSNDGYFTVR